MDKKGRFVRLNRFRLPVNRAVLRSMRDHLRIVNRPKSNNAGAGCGDTDNEWFGLNHVGNVFPKTPSLQSIKYNIVNFV